MNWAEFLEGVQHTEMANEDSCAAAQQGIMSDWTSSGSVTSHCISVVPALNRQGIPGQLEKMKPH